MSVLANAQVKAAKGNVKEAFKNEEGAIDLASIMVGIIVIGLIGGVIAATVFAVIPWAQDNAAKQQLESVASAQSAYIGLSEGLSYGTLTDGKLAFGTDVLFDATENDKIVVVGTEAAGTTPASYAASIESASGKYFAITDANPKPATATGHVSTPAA